jgi:hypothetical protein
VERINVLRLKVQYTQEERNLGIDRQNLEEERNLDTARQNLENYITYSLPQCRLPEIAMLLRENKH